MVIGKGLSRDPHAVMTQKCHFWARMVHCFSLGLLMPFLIIVSAQANTVTPQDASIQPFLAFELILLSWAWLNWRQARRLFQSHCTSCAANNQPIPPLRYAIKFRLQVTAVCLIAALFLAIAALTELGSQAGTSGLYGLLFAAFWFLLPIRIRRASSAHKAAKPQPGAGLQFKISNWGEIKLSPDQVFGLCVIALFIFLLFVFNPLVIVALLVLSILLSGLILALGIPMAIILAVAKGYEYGLKRMMAA